MEVAWAPPPRPVRSVVSWGAGQMVESGAGIRSNTADAEAALAASGRLVWTAAAVWSVAGGQRRLAVKPRRLAHGVEVVADAVIPWHVRRSDGWTCTAPNLPLSSEDISPWLVEAVGSRVTP